MLLQLRSNQNEVLFWAKSLRILLVFLSIQKQLFPRYVYNSLNFMNTTKVSDEYIHELWNKVFFLTTQKHSGLMIGKINGSTHYQNQALTANTVHSQLSWIMSC